VNFQVLKSFVKLIELINRDENYLVIVHNSNEKNEDKTLSKDKVSENVIVNAASDEERACKLSRRDKNRELQEDKRLI